jgi:hypothetical protein
MFTGETKDNFDASGFHSGLRKSREAVEDRKGGIVENQADNKESDFNENIRQKRVKKVKRGVEDVDLAQVDNEMKEIAESQDIKTVEDQGFKQVEFSEGDKTKRTAQVEINRDKAMDRFFAEDFRHGYKGRQEGGADDLNLAVHSKDGRTVELNLTEIRAMEKYMEEDLANADEEQTDKAA